MGGEGGGGSASESALPPPRSPTPHQRSLRAQVGAREAGEAAEVENEEAEEVEDLPLHLTLQSAITPKGIRIMCRRMLQKRGRNGGGYLS